MKNSKYARGTLSNVVELVEKNNLQAPATLVVGYVVNALLHDSRYEISYDPLEKLIREKQVACADPVPPVFERHLKSTHSIQLSTLALLILFCLPVYLVLPLFTAQLLPFY